MLTFPNFASQLISKIGIYKYIYIYIYICIYIYIYIYTKYTKNTYIYKRHTYTIHIMICTDTDHYVNTLSTIKKENKKK